MSTLEAAIKQVSDTKHNLNNLLMGVMGQLEILRDLPDMSDEGRARIDSVINQVQRIQEQVRELDAIGRGPSR